MNGKGSIHFSSGSSEWETPQTLFDKLKGEFNFVMDVCATQDNKKCDFFIDINRDALGKELWVKVFDSLRLVRSAGKFDHTFWMNPPYGRNIINWVNRAYNESKHCRVVCLLPSRTDTKWWSVFWDRSKHCPKPGIKVRFLAGRLKFGGSQNAAPFPSVVVVMDRRSSKAKTAKKKSNKKRG